MAKNNIRLAIVGCGTISQLNVHGYLEHPNCDVIALCDPIEDRARIRARQWDINPKIYTDFEQVLDDPDIDAVELLTPQGLHSSQSILALESGKHVSCQKPISNNMNEVDKIEKAVKVSGTIFRVTENFLYYPPLLKAKELIDSGVIGEPSIVRMKIVLGGNNFGYGETNKSFKIEHGALEWRSNPDISPNASLVDEGVHKYATAIWLVGQVGEIFSTISRPNEFMIEAPSVVTWRFKDVDCGSI